MLYSLSFLLLCAVDVHGLSPAKSSKMVPTEERFQSLRDSTGVTGVFTIQAIDHTQLSKQDKKKLKAFATGQATKLEAAYTESYSNAAGVSNVITMQEKLSNFMDLATFLTEDITAGTAAAFGAGAAGIPTDMASAGNAGMGIAKMAIKAGILKLCEWQMAANNIAVAQSSFGTKLKEVAMGRTNHKAFESRLCEVTQEVQHLHDVSLITSCVPVVQSSDPSSADQSPSKLLFWRSLGYAIGDYFKVGKSEKNDCFLQMYPVIMVYARNLMYIQRMSAQSRNCNNGRIREDFQIAAGLVFLPIGQALVEAAEAPQQSRVESWFNMAPTRNTKCANFKEVALASICKYTQLCNKASGLAPFG